MNAAARVLLILATATGTAAGTESHAALARPAGSVPLTFNGVVDIDRPDVLGITPVCRRLTVAWMCQDGQHVRKGEPIVLYDASVHQRQVPLKALETRRAEAERQRQNLRLEIDMTALEEEKAKLESELAVVRASLAKARNGDADRVALSRAEHELSVQKAAAERRALARKKALHELGEISNDEWVAAQLQMQEAEHEQRLSLARWEHLEKRVETLKVAQLELKQLELLEALGRDVVGEAAAAETRGIERRIEALRRRIESERAKNQAALDRATKAWHHAVRDGYDHTPLNFIEIFAARTPAEAEPAIEAGAAPQPAGEEAIRRIAFGPQGRPLPEGYELDAGLPFDEARGFGWDRDLQNAAHDRPKGAGLTGAVILIRAESIWKCALPNGDYRVRIGVGDAFDWHGAIIRHFDRVVWVADKVETPQVVEVDLTVHDGALALTIADGHEKAMRAPADGVARPQPWLRVGRTIRWNSWPLVYFCDPQKFKVSALVRQDDVALLKVAGAEDAERGTDVPGEGAQLATLRIAMARQRVATPSVAITTPGGARLAGEVSSIGNDAVELARGAAVWYWGDEKRGKDMIARQVMITPGDTERGKLAALKIGETVRCTAWIEPRDGMFAVAAHLVSQSGPRHFATIAATGERREIEGFRAGRSFVVIGGLERAVSLAMPTRALDHQRSRADTFAGEVVPGKRVQVGIAEGWGRIKDMVDDGSRVEKGQQIIRLYNPWIDNNREQLVEDKIKAQQEYLVAVEARRVKTVQAQLEHNEKVISEREARLTLRELEEQDPLPLAKAQATWDAAERVRQVQADRYSRYQSLADVAPAELESARVEALKARLRAVRAQVEHVAALRHKDWLDIDKAGRTWLDRVDALSLRETALGIVRREDRVARMVAELQLQRAMEGNRWERRFERIKIVKAPASGRIFYLTGWNDHLRARTKIMKDFFVWRGLPIAEVLDMSELGMEVELPESEYGRAKVGDEAVVGFDAFPGVEMDGRVHEIGNMFFVPEDQEDSEHGEQPVSLTRVFRVEVRFTPPPQLADEFVPGTRGTVQLP